MPKKRRNNGRCMNNRGNVRALRCDNCGRTCGGDKIIKRFVVKNIVDAATQRDIKESRALAEFTLPKVYYKMRYCISCGVHNRTVRARSKEAKKIRTNPILERREKRIIEEHEKKLQQEMRGN